MKDGNWNDAMPDAVAAQRLVERAWRMVLVLVAVALLGAAVLFARRHLAAGTLSLQPFALALKALLLGALLLAVMALYGVSHLVERRRAAEPEIGDSLEPRAA